jgi:tRNA (guanine10-N2)-methyltransferase
MEFLIRFGQTHESFRVAEIQALAELEGIHLEIIDYRADVPFCTVRLGNEHEARRLVRRSILAQTIHELWGTANTLDGLHAEVRSRSAHLWARYKTASFKFSHDSFQGARSIAAKREAMEALSYLGFDGPIRMNGPDEEFTIFEEWLPDAVPLGLEHPERLHFGRLVGGGARDLARHLDLKKRTYISTTSMDSELALVTANIALAGPGKLVYDPFVGTGSFPVACAQFGAVAFGSDIDGRSIRGDGGKRSLRGNFAQYGIEGLLGGVFAADLTNTPVRAASPTRLFDAIVCDPPYGVREGLHVLGIRDADRFRKVLENGVKNYK